jgi:hypothetical protein
MTKAPKIYCGNSVAPCTPSMRLDVDAVGLSSPSRRSGAVYGILLLDTYLCESDR